MCRLMIDTNVLLDTLDARRPESLEAREVLSRCNGWGDFGMASSHSFKDVYYIVGRMQGEAFARAAVQALMDLVAIAPVDSEVCDEAIRSSEPDFEDGLVRACAELNGADFIVTRNKAAYTNCRIRSVTAAEYLRIAKANDGETGE